MAAYYFEDGPFCLLQLLSCCCQPFLLFADDDDEKDKGNEHSPTTYDEDPYSYDVAAVKGSSLDDTTDSCNPPFCSPSSVGGSTQQHELFDIPQLTTPWKRCKRLPFDDPPIPTTSSTHHRRRHDRPPELIEIDEFSSPAAVEDMYCTSPLLTTTTTTRRREGGALTPRNMTREFAAMAAAENPNEHLNEPASDSSTNRGTLVVSAVKNRKKARVLTSDGKDHPELDMLQRSTRHDDRIRSTTTFDLTEIARNRARMVILAMRNRRTARLVRRLKEMEDSSPTTITTSHKNDPPESRTIDFLATMKKKKKINWKRAKQNSLARNKEPYKTLSTASLSSSPGFFTVALVAVLTTMLLLFLASKIRLICASSN